MYYNYSIANTLTMVTNWSSNLKWEQRCTQRQFLEIKKLVSLNAINLDRGPLVSFLTSLSTLLLKIGQTLPLYLKFRLMYIFEWDKSGNMRWFSLVAFFSSKIETSIFLAFQVQMKKTIRAFEKKKTENYVEKTEEGAVPGERSIQTTHIRFKSFPN